MRHVGSPKNSVIEPHLARQLPFYHPTSHHASSTTDDLHTFSPTSPGSPPPYYVVQCYRILSRSQRSVNTTSQLRRTHPPVFRQQDPSEFPTTISPLTWSKQHLTTNCPCALSHDQRTTVSCFSQFHCTRHGISSFSPEPLLLQHINSDIFELRAPVLTTVFLLFADDVCLVTPQPL